MSQELELLKRTLVGATILDIEYEPKNDCPLTLILDNGDTLQLTANGDDMTYLNINVTNEFGINTINL